MVINDYQQVVEDRWLANNKKYPVKVNDAVIKRLSNGKAEIQNTGLCYYSVFLCHRLLLSENYSFFLSKKKEISL